MGNPFMTGFAGSLGDALQKKLDQQSANDQKQKDAQAQIYLDAIRSGRLSPDQITYALGQVQKIYGNSKPMKEILGKVGGIFGQLHDKLSGGGGASGGANPAAGAQGQPSGVDPNSIQLERRPAAQGGAAGPGLPPAPASAATSTSAVVPGQTPGTTPPTFAGPSGLPAPPSFASITSAAFPSPTQLSAEKSQQDTQNEIDHNKALAAAAGIKPGTPDFQELMINGKLSPDRPLAIGTYTDPSTGKSFTGGVVPNLGGVVDLGSGQVVTGATKMTAGEQAAPKVATDNGGVPYGVTRNGKLVTPDSPDWTADDKRVFDAASAAFKTGEKAKQQRQQVYMDAYAKMRGQVYQYAVRNTATGNLEYRNADEINAAPEGMFAPASQAQQQYNRVGVFNEIDFSLGQLDQSIDKLGSQSFNAAQRAQIAYILSDSDPRSALSAFLNSEVAGTLSPEQLNYVTSLASAQESAMSLRSIAGMGSGSDMLRGAILRMLPSGSTPSKDYAKRQLQLLRGEVKQLKGPVPSNISKALPPPPGTPASSSATGVSTPKTADDYLNSIGAGASQ